MPEEADKRNVGIVPRTLSITLLAARGNMAYETGPRVPGDEEDYDVVMCVVDEPLPDNRILLAAQAGNEGPLLVGSGHTNFLCGNCRTVLAGNVSPEEIEGTPLLQCYACGAYNEIPEG